MLLLTPTVVFLTYCEVKRLCELILSILGPIVTRRTDDELANTERKFH